MSDHEVITLAFGNYSSLVAAQWANGTSRFDMARHTLYTECRSSEIVGGGAADGESAREVARVPRLLLFDAPYSSYFAEVEDLKHELDVSSNDDEEEKDGSAPQDSGESDAMDVLAFLQGKTDGLRSGTQHADAARGKSRDTNAARRVDGWAAKMQKRVLFDGLPEEDEEDEELDLYGDEDDSEDATAKLRAALGIPVWSAEGAEDYTTTRDGDEEADEKKSSSSLKARKAKLRKLKKRLFYTHDSTIPWWRYITTGLAHDAVTTLRPLHNIDGSGDVPALHNFGYGLAHVRESKSDESAQFLSALRRQVERADYMQGVQCFSDGDGLFGGVASNTLHALWEEMGEKIPVVHCCAFTPLPDVFRDAAQAATIDFAERRRDEVALNRILAFTRLSQHDSGVLIPVALDQWADFFRGASTAAQPDAAPAWVQDQTATAQYLAAVADTALYGLRDGKEEGHGAAYSMRDWTRVVKPATSMRIAAMMGSLPMAVQAAGANGGAQDLWKFLERHPLLPDVSELALQQQHHTSAPATSAAGPRSGFFSLTHSINKYSPLEEAGRVLGHAVSLRGAGSLPSQVYPAQEAMLRYAIPLRTSTYLPLLTKTNYPISSTFPMDLLFRDPAHATAARGVVQNVDVGAHVLSTYASAPMLKEAADKAKQVLRRKMDFYAEAYLMEQDEWREVLEEMMEMHDDYHHDAPSSGDDDDD